MVSLRSSRRRPQRHRRNLLPKSKVLEGRSPACLREYLATFCLVAVRVSGRRRVVSDAPTTSNASCTFVACAHLQNIDGINFLFIKKNGIYFVTTTKFNVSPSFILELLDRIAKVFKDYCGVLTEESIRKNFILLYELLDEMIDYGYPQSTSTETLKMYVHNEPVPVETLKSNSGMLSSKKTISSTAVQRPVSLGATGGAKSNKNEIYVDILERLTVLFNSNGYILNSTIDGCIQMKSYLSGNPGIRFALNEDLVVGKDNATSYGGLVLDDCLFHECVNTDDFESGRTLALMPPDGEFVAMQYRLTSEFRAPFRVFPVIEESSPYKVDVVLKVRGDFPEKNNGTNVVIKFPVPKSATTVIPEIGVDHSAVAAQAAAARGVSAAIAAGAAGPGVGQHAEFDTKTREVVWQIKKFQGGTEQTLRTRITLGSPAGSSLRKELGPISMSFEIPMFNVSGLQVRIFIFLCGGVQHRRRDSSASSAVSSLPPPPPRFRAMPSPSAGQIFEDRRAREELQALPMGAIRHHFKQLRVQVVSSRASSSNRASNSPCLVLSPELRPVRQGGAVSLYCSSKTYTRSFSRCFPTIDRHSAVHGFHVDTCTGTGRPRSSLYNCELARAASSGRAVTRSALTWRRRLAMCRFRTHR